MRGVVLLTHQQRSNLTKEKFMPVFKMTKEECIAEMMTATERTARTQSICSHFYQITGELISAYC
tara:strand:+ start:676 stop:870 length:195 start_codon:yes stop_codon:yes gene_type:complete